MSWKKFAKISGLFAVTSMLLGFVYSYHAPKIKSWILVEVEKQSQKHLPLRLWPQSVDLNVFPIGVSVYNVHMIPKPPLNQRLASTLLEQIDINLNLWSLLRGQFKIGQIKIIKGTLKYIRKKPPDSRGGRQQPLVDKKLINFDLLPQLPFQRMTLENIDVYAKDDLHNLSLYVDSLNLDIHIASKSLLTIIETPRVKLKEKNLLPILEIGGMARMRLSERQIQVTSAKLKRDNSFLIASGEIIGDFTQAQYDSLNITTLGNISLDDLNRLINEIFPAKKIPHLNGNINFNIQVKHKNGQEPQLNVDLKSKNVHVDGFEVGNLQIKGKNKRGNFEASLFKAENSGVRASIDHLKIKLKDNYSFSGNVHIAQFDLRKFLNTLKVKNTPLYLDINGKLPCGGQVQPEFKLSCTGDLKSSLLHVHNGAKQPTTIIRLSDIHAKGDLQVSSKDVKYKARIGFPEAKGHTDGVINFKNGFRINYGGEIKNLSKVEDLLNLELNGSAKLKGSTKGNSRQATFDMAVQGNEALLKGWTIGNPRFQIEYRKGILKINKIIGNIESTRYNGFLSINASKNQIFLKMNSPFFEADILNTAFKQKFNFNPNLHGTGTARIKLWGPLNISQLNYELNSEVHRGSLYGEGFDGMTFNISAEKGKIKANEVFIKKRGGSLSVTGFVQPGGSIDAKLHGRNIAIEQLDNFENIGLNLSGQLDFGSHFSGPFARPTTKVKGKISKVIVGDLPTEDSSFNLHINEKKISGQVQFTGGVVASKFNIPRSKGEPFSLSIDTKDWNFARFFSIFTKSVEEKVFDSKMTSQLILNSEEKGPWKASGHGTISQFEIRRGPVSMSAKKPMRVLFSNGSMKTKNFNITGENTSLELKSKHSTYDNLDLSIDGTIDLSLAILIAPFLDELRGRLSFSTQIFGPLGDFNMQGSADMTEALIQIKHFPHKFEKVSASLLFNKRSLLIDALHADLTGGKVKAWGQVDFPSLNHAPIDIKAEFKDISINVPEGVKTEGSGYVHLQGSQFPYDLSGKYTIVNGNITKNFGLPSGNSKQKIKPSIFLPEFMNKAKLKPIDLDFDLYVKKPLDIRTRVNTSDIEAKMNGNIKVLGSYDSVLLRGNLEIGRGGKVSFRSNIFDIKTGQITYEDSPPQQPIILLSADTRVEGTDINLLAQGKATSPKIHLTSHPPMPENDIVSLLVFGFTSKISNIQGQLGLEEENRKYSTFQAASAILNEQLGITRGLNDQLGVRVDISSSYDKTQGTTIPSVTARKQWTPDFGASISRTIGNTVPTNFLQTEYRFNKNISVIGSFEQKESEATETNEQDSDILGLDLEYRFEFNLNDK